MLESLTPAVLQNGAYRLFIFVFLFIFFFWRDYNIMIEKKISFLRPPTEFDYGTVAVFEDLYGNLWDLIEPNEKNQGLIRE